MEEFKTAPVVVMLQAGKWEQPNMTQDAHLGMLNHQVFKITVLGARLHPREHQGPKASTRKTDGATHGR